jgi:hypothetical protein
VNTYLAGIDSIAGDAPAPTSKPKESFLQKEAFGGLRVWQVGLGGVGVALILSGVIVAAVKR